MLLHLLFSPIDADIKIISRAVFRAVPVLSDPLRRIANLRRVQLKKGAFLEKRAECLCGRVRKHIPYLLPTKVTAMTNAELLHGWLQTNRQPTHTLTENFRSLVPTEIAR